MYAGRIAAFGAVISADHGLISCVFLKGQVMKNEMKATLHDPAVEQECLCTGSEPTKVSRVSDDTRIFDGDDGQAVNRGRCAARR